MNRTKRNAGFTLVELLAVITIIAILAGLVLGVSGYASRKASESRAIADMEKLRNALEEYKIEYGAYPATADFYDADVMAELSNFVSDITFSDPWDNGYTYELDSGGFSYSIMSSGVVYDTSVTDHESDDISTATGYK